MNNKKEKEEDQITISISPELHSALIMAALKYKTSISRVIEDTLRNVEEFRSEFLPKAIELVETSNKKEEKDQITISIPPELYRALFMAALEHGTNISQIIEDTLRNVEEFRNIYLPKVREYDDDKAPELSAASPHSLKWLRREEQKKKKI